MWCRWLPLLWEYLNHFCTCDFVIYQVLLSSGFGSRIILAFWRHFADSWISHDHIKLCHALSTMKHTRCITNIENCNSNDFNKPATAERRMLRESCAKLGNQLRFTQGKKDTPNADMHAVVSSGASRWGEGGYRPSQGENIGLEILINE